MTKRQKWRLRNLKLKYYRVFKGFYDVVGVLAVALGMATTLSGAFLVLLGEWYSVAVLFAGFSIMVLGSELIRYGSGKKSRWMDGE
jgi:voltage-gated potassium channel Kch